MKIEGQYHLTYSARHIIAILDNYASVSDGNFDVGQSQTNGSKPNRNIFRAPFENSIISKADIDNAIDSLGKPGRWGIWCKNPEQSPAGYNLTPMQYKLAEYIRGNYSQIKGLAHELAKIA